MDHMGMDMGGDGSDTCKISMLWNWTTIDACFLSSSWHIRNNGMFAASCIGVALLTVTLEALRRISREYDALIARQWRAHAVAQSRLRARRSGASTSSRTPSAEEDTTAALDVLNTESAMLPSSITLRVTPVQQLIRAVLHAATFGVAYIIMLLAMYFNGYIIISIFIGAGLGKFACDWMSATISLADESQASTGAQSKYGAVDEPTVCCG